MYRNSDINDSYISLHDCCAEKMSFENGVLSFDFPDGFWVTDKHPENKSDNIVRTDTSKVQYEIIDNEIDGIRIYIFKQTKLNKIIREEWEPENFISAVNNGDFKVEFITQYKAFQSILHKCWVWFDKAPYHFECEIILETENVKYNWNRLRYDSVWW